MMIRDPKPGVGLRRLRGLFLPRSVADLDPWPTPLLLLLGLIPAAGLAWLASRSLVATVLLVLLIPVAAIWQGRRIRVVWEPGTIPAEVEETQPERYRPAIPEPAVETPEPPESSDIPSEPQPPYPVQDQLIEMIELPGGTFRTGNEWLHREVSIQPFAMARTPVTRGLYRSLVKAPPKAWKSGRDELPANSVSWEDAVCFCNTLSERSGHRICYRESGTGWVCDWEADGYRLPTEAEWEYACRAGTQTPWFWGEQKEDAVHFAWFADNSSIKPHPVGEKKPNPWGLYDMAGNVWEWCWDWYATYDPRDLDNPEGPAEGESRVLRGGSFGVVPRSLRSARRGRFEPVGLNFDIGFRCVRGSGQLG